MKILHFETIDSTSKYLIENHNVLDDLTCAYADFQTQGKGRNDRKWMSNKSQNLLCSFLIKSQKVIDEFQRISLCSAVCVLNVLQKLNVNNVKIKWPNDVYVNDKKICGILLQGQIPNYLVIGIGINVNQIEFKDEYRVVPTSIKKEIGKNISIKLLLNNLIDEVSNMLNNLENYMNIALDNDYLKDKVISYDAFNNGKCLGIQKNGSLKIKHDGEIIYLSSGEIVTN